MAALSHPFTKMLLLPILLFSFLSAVTVLGLAAWVKDHILSDDLSSDFQRNAASDDLIDFALTAGVVAVASYIITVHYLRVRTTASLSAAQGAAFIAFLLLTLPFAFAFKELHLKNRGVGLIVLEAFVIFLTVIHFLYTLHLYLVDR